MISDFENLTPGYITAAVIRETSAASIHTDTVDADGSAKTLPRESVNHPLNLVSHAKAMLVEQIMALIGRASPYRRILEDMEIATLQRLRDHLVEEGSEGFGLWEFKDFPAVSLTENAGVIASADKGIVPDSSRELTLKLTLP